MADFSPLPSWLPLWGVSGEGETPRPLIAGGEAAEFDVEHEETPAIPGSIWPPKANIHLL